MDKNFKRGFGCMVLELIAWIVPGSPTAPDCLPQTVADLFPLIFHYTQGNQSLCEEESGIVDFVTTFGAHRVALESPDILHCVFRGQFSEEEAHTMVQTIQQAGARFGLLFACVDVRDFRTSGPKVRAIMASAGGRAYPFRAAAVFGASLSIRTAMNLVIRAARLFRSDVFAFPIEFVATKEDAIGWLATQREQSAR